MSNKWTQLALKPPFAAEANALLDSADNLISQIQDALNLVKQILEIARLAAIIAAGDPVEAIIRQIINELENLLVGLAEHTQLHAIIIPIQKQPFGLGVEVNLDALGLTPDEAVPTAATMDEFGQFTGTANTYADSNTRAISERINRSRYAVGGNMGFYRTLVESIYDVGDINRPLFSPNFAVAGGCLLLGTQSFTTLSKILSLLSVLFRLGDRTDPLRNVYPTAQRLRANVIPITTVAAQPGRIGVSLSWAKLPLRINFPLYNEEEAIVTEVVVIRSVSPDFRERFSWSEIFPTDLSNEITDYPSTSTGNTRVIKRIRHDGFTAGYVDDDPELKENQTYYYAIALRCEIKGEALTMGPLSNVVRVQFIRPTASMSSEPPDWLATPSLVSLMPVLEEIVGLIRLLLAEIKSKSISGPTILDQLISAITFLVQRSDAALAILREIVDLLRAITNNDVGLFYSTSYSVPYGGIEAWHTELARRLFDPSDTSRPPYDNPRDLVTGLIVVGGAPVIGQIDTTTPFNAQIAALEALLALLFGSGGSPESQQLIPGPAIPENPLITAVNSLDGLVTALEKTTFNPAMTAAKVPVNTTTTTPAIAFDSQMLPSKTLC